MFVIFIQIFDK